MVEVDESVRALDIMERREADDKRIQTHFVEIQSASMHDGPERIFTGYENPVSATWCVALAS